MFDGISAWLGEFIRWLTDTIFALGYPGIVVLMAIESSVFPLPSELIMPPAGFLAAQGRMNPWLAVLAGAVGSVAGALLNYTLAKRLGRPLLHRYGKYFLIKEKTLDRAEAYFRDHGEISTFIGRLVPLLRHYISLPAGLAQMRLDRFALYTGLGAGIWCAILTWVGWYIGLRAAALGQLPTAEVHAYVRRALLVLAPFVLAVVVAYVLFQRGRRLRGGSSR